MMKTRLFIMLALSTFVYQAQIKLTTKGKEVKELTCDMTDVKLKIDIPDEAKKYDVIEIQVHRHPDANMKQITYESLISDFNFRAFYQRYQQSWAESNSSVTYQLVNNDGTGSNDFSNAYLYSLKEPCSYGLRNFDALYNRVVILGGTHNGWEWKDNEKIKTYEYSTIKEYSFKHKIGSIDENMYAPGRNIGMSRENVDLAQIKYLDSDNSLQYDHFTEEEGGGGTMDFGAPASESVQSVTKVKMMTLENTTIENAKITIEQDIVKITNYRYSSNLESPLSLFDNDFPSVYINVSMANLKSKESGSEKGSKLKGGLGKLAKSYGVGGNNGADKEKLQAVIDNSSAHFSWDKTTINGTEFTLLDLPVYDKKQTELDNNGNPVLKGGEKGNTKTMRYLLTEKDGKIYAVSIIQTGDANKDEKAKAFLNQVMETLVVK